MYLPSIGLLIPRASFQPLKLVQLYTNTELIYCSIYIILILYYTYIEIQLIIKCRFSYAKHIWSYINWAIIIISWTGVAFHFIRQSELKRLGKLFKNLHGHHPINLQYASYLNSLFTYQLGFCCFFATIKLLHLLRFDPRLTLFWLTLKKAKGSLFGFAIMFSFIFMSFISLFYLLFNVHLAEFSTLFKTTQTCFEMITLDFRTARNLKDIDMLLGSICLFLFVIFVVCFLVNMLISIIIDDFNLIRRNTIKENRHHEIVNCIRNKVYRFFGLRKSQYEEKQQINYIAAFPEKIEQLFTALDKIYDDEI